MTLFDFIAIGIIGLSTLIALMRGVVTELASLVGWVVSFTGAKLFTPQVSEIAMKDVQPETLKYVGTFVLLFVLLLVAQYFLRSLLTALIKSIGLDGINKLLGGVFGAARGVLIVTVLVLICSMTSLSQTPEWRTAQTVGFFQQLASIAIPYLPKQVADVISSAN
ncbi:CvpA family protein [Neisseria sp. Ec49-e6-T10]|uniref:CvpA family protein n=1 Tax=Neisseria sp. Ec49-e6-T10 TaxID=3140744 RepID=UPI003EBBA4FA